MSVKADYAKLIQAMDDADFVNEVETKVWLSAFASNNPRSDYHWQVDECYDEANRREKPYLYQRGWNAACQSEGHQPSENYIELAKGPVE